MKLKTAKNLLEDIEFALQTIADGRWSHIGCIEVASKALPMLHEIEQYLEIVQEPVAWRVTGPLEDIPFKDRSSAEAFCKGLNEGYGENVYSVSALCTAPPSIAMAARAIRNAAVNFINNTPTLDDSLKLYLSRNIAAIPIPDHLPDATKKVEPPKLHRAGSFGE